MPFTFCSVAIFFICFSSSTLLFVLCFGGLPGDGAAAAPAADPDVSAAAGAPVPGGFAGEPISRANMPPLLGLAASPAVPVAPVAAAAPGAAGKGFNGVVVGVVGVVGGVFSLRDVFFFSGSGSRRRTNASGKAFVFSFWFSLIY